MVILRKLSPIRGLIRLVGEVSQGKVNVNINRDDISNDEIGMLTQDVCGLVDVIKGMVEDLANVHTEYIKLGNKLISCLKLFK